MMGTPHINAPKGAFAKTVFFQEIQKELNGLQKLFYMMLN